VQEQQEEEVGALSAESGKKKKLFSFKAIKKLFS
jgi:hypothetical protein